MSREKLLTLLAKTTGPVLTDGAMGTMLHGRGVPFGTCFDELNLSRPALVGEIHRAYIEAGAQIILTNTFGANPYKLAMHGLADKLTEINRGGVDLARRIVAASFKDVLVAGDIGPLGVHLVPFGRVTKEQAREAFTAQMTVLVEAGVDLLVIETLTDLYEMEEAIAAARSLCDLPVVASMTFTRDDRTLLGDSPAKVARRLYEAGADVIGVNCSGGPAQLVRLVQQMREAVPEGRFWVKPNAGWPEQVAGRIMYPATPAYFGEYAWAFCQAGANFIGGCCGTTPAHIAALRAALDAGPPVVCTPLERAAVLQPVRGDIAPDQPSVFSQKVRAGEFVIAVEMDPPRGLSTHKLLAGATLLSEAGADVINVADSPMARMRMSPWAVCALIQDKVGVEATLHFPIRGRNLLRVQGDLLAAHALGIRNVFVVMGDPTSIGDYPQAMDNYDLTSTGLIQLIKEKFNTGVDYAGSDIGQPTTFFVGAALNLTSSDPDNEMKVLRRKLQAGADFFLTQPVYDPATARAFLDQYAEKYGPLDKPVLVGVLPLYGVKHARFLHNEVPGITIAPEFFERLEAAGSDSPREGVRIALELIAQIRDWAGGIYLMPAFNRYDLAAEIVEQIHQT
ncbi:MAG TPA: bifunctional homocysteine S-methyltransferase/methylenetetrahydrofolate reductase [Anaerolineae bacterium]|nr:bifunctional homocysteine S-methyltransferase/methylenetetrahydrofolate reductase [Anaerolineae bacterium]HQK15168.1 bifunctional homocysteine S-methyltransferase/methylenetetrahydrofolate reductase [Anaerolineae bacterium]